MIFKLVLVLAFSPWNEILGRSLAEHSPLEADGTRMRKYRLQPYLHGYPHISRLHLQAAAWGAVGGGRALYTRGKP